jgi:hypothetical protein
VAVQDLRPNSQDTSAFYLGNIYEILADPNATRPSIPSVPKPPPFSPPRYAIWVNSLWFLSFVLGLICALLATSFQQWTRRYIRATQSPRHSPEQRARMRVFFASGLQKMDAQSFIVELLPILLHLALFLFFGGLGVFLFNTNHAVFDSVVWLIASFSVLYGAITLRPLFQLESPYFTPLTAVVFRAFHFEMAIFLIGSFFSNIAVPGLLGSDHLWLSAARHARWMIGGMEKAAEETVSKRSTQIDIDIFDWTMRVLREDDSLEKFFEAVPGFFSPKLERHIESVLPEDIFFKFWDLLNGFMNHTFTSNAVTESVKARRVTICRNIVNMIPCPLVFIYDPLSDLFDQGPVSIPRLNALARWRDHKDDFVADCARVRFAKSLARVRVQERDYDWIALASSVCDSAHDLRDDIAHGGDNVLLATLIAVSCRAIFDDSGIVKTLTQFDIRHTLPGLQHDFCTLWNDLVQEARIRGHHTAPVFILRRIRHLYIALHQGTDAAPTAFSASTCDTESVLYQPSSYLLCDIASHRPGSTTHDPVVISGTVSLSTHPGDSPYAPPPESTFGGSTALRLAEETNTISGLPSPPDPSITSRIGETSQDPRATFPIPLGSPSSHGSPRYDIATAQPDTTSAATLTHPLESNVQQQGLTTPYVASRADISGILSNVPTLPVPASATYDASPASTSKSLLPAPSPNFSAPDSPLPLHVLPLPNAELFSLLSGTSPKGPPDDDAQTRLRPRKLVNGNMYLANTVLQLLVYCPPFRELFGDLGRLQGQRERGVTDGSVTPLVDATVKFLDELAYKEKPPWTHQHLQQVARSKAREDEDGKEEDDSVQSTYVYDAMKEKRQFIVMRVRSCAHVVALFTDPCRSLCIG